MSSPTSAKLTDERLAQLLEVGTFPPPPGFTARSRVHEAAIEKASADGPAWWAEQARERLDWDTAFTTVLDESNPLSIPGSPTAGSTPPTTAWTGMSRLVMVTGSRSTGSARRVSAAT